MSAKVPQIVKELNLGNQTSGLSETLFTPTNAGNYRVSVYIDVAPSSASAGFVTPTVSWNDGASPASTTTETLQNAANNGDGVQSSPGRGTIPFLHAAAGSNISLSVSDSLSTAVPYNIYVVVEQL